MKCKRCSNSDIDKFDYNMDLTGGKLQLICKCCGNYQDITKEDIKELGKIKE